MVVGIGITILSIGVSDSIGVAESAIFHLWFRSTHVGVGVGVGFIFCLWVIRGYPKF
jgi:hypothetical protein